MARLKPIADFKDVLKSEHDSITKRRVHNQDELVALGHNIGEVKEVHPPRGGDDQNNPDRKRTEKSRGDAEAGSVYDTIGVALSGGGIRSAAFCLGALQALDVAKVFKRVDYLSTVSGGGYIGSSLTAALDNNGGEFPFASRLQGDESPSIQHIRDYSNFLIPSGPFDVWQSASIYLRGLAANIFLVIPWLLLAAGLTIWWKPTRAALRQSNPWLASATGLSFFNITVAAILVLAIALIVWALWRSSKFVMEAADIPNRFTSAFAFVLIFLALIAVIEFQPFVLDSYFGYLETRSSGAKGTSYLEYLTKILVTVLAPLTAAVAFLNDKLGFMIKRATETSSFQTRALAAISKGAIYLSACAVPLLLWLVYLALTYWGIKWNETLEPLKVADWSIPYIAALYAVLWLVLFLASAILQPNSNSMHRLYRDRLSKAFIFEPLTDLKDPAEQIPALEGVKFSSLSEKMGPYQLINTALNIQASKVANRRGRNADFFLFSRNYTGSRTTCYVNTRLLERKEPMLDIGTAMAVSGAAASANMGSSTIKSWTLSLAMLNVRLGFWMRNPKFVVNQNRVMEKLNELFNPYFAYEMFGLLNEKRWFVYLTDGGHVENLGIYELLKRQCQLIIAVDAEADPDLNFGSLITLQRYARIDLGVRIELPWYDIRQVSLDTNKVVRERGDAKTIISRGGPHCALGKIYYPAGGEGYLLYVKSSLTGDESDYVMDYKRRHDAFPHETTGDQFFSEEQFEVYRALGFHALQGVFFDRDRIAITQTKPDTGTGSGVARPGFGYTDEQQDLLKKVRDILRFKEDPQTLSGVVASGVTQGGQNVTTAEVAQGRPDHAKSGVSGASAA